jgi:hypothetical protein
MHFYNRVRGNWKGLALLAVVFALCVPALALADGNNPPVPPGQVTTTTTTTETTPGDNGNAKDNGKGNNGTPGAANEDQGKKPDAKDPGKPDKPQTKEHPSHEAFGGLEGDNSNGCSGSIKTTDATGSVVNANKYTVGDPIYISGSNFNASQSFTFIVQHVQDKTTVNSGSFVGGGDGSFLQSVWSGESAVGHEYKVIVFYTLANGHRCHKSDNFFFTGAKETGKVRVQICHATGSDTNPYVLLTLPEEALNGHRKHAGDLIPAPVGGCPTSAEVQAQVEIARAPLSVTAGQSLTVIVQSAPGSIVTASGAGVKAAAAVPAGGKVTLVLHPKTKGFVVVKGVRGPIKKVGVLGVRSSGASLTG